MLGRPSANFSEPLAIDLDAHNSLVPNENKKNIDEEGTFQTLEVHEIDPSIDHFPEMPFNSRFNSPIVSPTATTDSAAALAAGLDDECDFDDLLPAAAAGLGSNSRETPSNANANVAEVETEALAEALARLHFAAASATKDTALAAREVTRGEAAANAEMLPASREQTPTKLQSQHQQQPPTAITADEVDEAGMESFLDMGLDEWFDSITLTHADDKSKKEKYASSTLFDVTPEHIRAPSPEPQTAKVIEKREPEPEIAQGTEVLDEYEDDFADAASVTSLCSASLLAPPPVRFSPVSAAATNTHASPVDTSAPSSGSKTQRRQLSGTTIPSSPSVDEDKDEDYGEDSFGKSL